jgi:hypothetical protein
MGYDDTRDLHQPFEAYSSTGRFLHNERGVGPSREPTWTSAWVPEVVESLVRGRWCGGETAAG